MTPAVKTGLIVTGSMISIVAVPAVIVVFRDYLAAFFAVSIILSCFALFGYECYRELLPMIRQQQIEEDEIMHRFHGDPEKIRFYRAFKKHFDGELTLEELKEWFINHPRKH